MARSALWQIFFSAFCSPSAPMLTSYVQSMTFVCHPRKSMRLIAAISARVRMGCLSSMRYAWPAPTVEISPSGPMKVRSEVTTLSRKGSIAGLVTCSHFVNFMLPRCDRPN